MQQKIHGRKNKQIRNYTSNVANGCSRTVTSFITLQILVPLLYTNK